MSTYNSKYFTNEQIDQRLLQGYYDDAVTAGYTGTKAEFLEAIIDIIHKHESEEGSDVDYSQMINISDAATILLDQIFNSARQSANSARQSAQAAQSSAEEAAEKVTQIGSKLGDLTELETEDKTDLVSAINEIKEATEDLSSDAVDISYTDNQGLGSTNVQGALDKLGAENKKLYDYDTISCADLDWYSGNINENWQQTTYANMITDFIDLSAYQSLSEVRVTNPTTFGISINCFTSNTLSSGVKKIGITPTSTETVLDLEQYGTKYIRLVCFDKPTQAQAQAETFSISIPCSRLDTMEEELEMATRNSLDHSLEEGFFIADKEHNVGLKYDGNGLDAAKLSTHFKELIQGDVRQEVMNLKQPTVSGDTANIVSIGILSDIHADAVNLAAFIECCKNYRIDYMLHLGDATYEYNYGKASSYSFWTGVEGNDEIMNIVGNHDSRRSGSWTGVPQTEVYDCIINTFKNNVTIVQPTDAEANGLCYYYKDLNTHVRLICLDCMFWNQAEYDWLSSVLDDAKTNSMHVIIACHYPTNDITLAESSWNCRLKGAKITDTSIGSQPSYLDKYTPTMASDLVQSFIDGGGKFIAWICGHQHRNWLGHLTVNPNQLQFCVPSSRWDYSIPIYFCELGSINQHCFTIIGIDTKNGYLKAVRIGKRNDSFMQKQQQFCYDYLNNELIYTA